MTKKVPKSTQKYRKVREDHRFFHRGATKVAKNTQNYQKSTQKYSKVHKSKGGQQVFLSQGRPQKLPKILKMTKKCPKVLKSTEKTQNYSYVP